MLTGAFTLLMTPFNKDLSLDEKGLRTLVRFQVENGIHGIAPLGVTGESPSLSEEEVRRVVEICVEEANGRCLVAPDTCSNNIDQTLARVRAYAELGCDYAVVFAPFLVKPTQQGLIEFYERVADASPKPVLIHNAPDRAAVSVETKTYARLMKHGNIVGAKDGVKELDHLAKLLYLARKTSFSVCTGKDTTAYPLLAFGGHGVFTVAGNILPKVMKNICEYAFAGEWDKARELHYTYFELFEALRLETNPMAVKEALALMGMPGGGFRPPLTPLSDSNKEKVKTLLRDRGLI